MTPTPKWTVKFTEQAERTFAKLDKPVQKAIAQYLSKRLLNVDNPRSLGKSLKGNFSDYWRYRCGNYRIICKIEDEELVILVVLASHRKDAYVNH